MTSALKRRASAGGRRSRRQLARRTLFRISYRMTDVILLAQVLGLLANAIWFLEISTLDIVGFVYIGGDIAGLFAYFSFVLFGMFFLFLAPRRFWRSLHPLTMGLALVMLASHRLWHAPPLLLIVAAIAGACGGYWLLRPILRWPQAALALSLLMLFLARFTIPRELAVYTIIFAGAALITLTLGPARRRFATRFTRRSLRRKNAPGLT